jgi:hypothetical protein
MEITRNETKMSEAEIYTKVFEFNAFFESIFNGHIKPEFEYFNVQNGRIYETSCSYAPIEICNK